MNDCTTIRDLLSPYYDGELDEASRREVEQHLLTCDWCRAALADFEKLSELANELPAIDPPKAIWSELSGHLQRDQTEPAKTATVDSDTRHAETISFPWFRRIPPRALAAAAALLIIASFAVGYSLLSHDDHELIRREITWLAENLNREDAADYLPRKYDGQPVDPERFEPQYGYRPVAFRSLPDGYAIENAHVMEMPCCRCIQRVCRKPDGSRVVILEHDNAEHGLMENSQAMMCNGVECHCAELDGKMVASLKQDGRTVTVIGELKKDDLDQLVASWSAAQGR